MAPYKISFFLLLFVIASGSLSFAKEEVLRAARTQQITNLKPDTLKFLGEGSFWYLGVKIYQAAFYLDPSISDPRQALTDAPKRLVIRYFRDIPRKALIQAAEKNIRNNPNADFASLKTRIDRLHEKYKDLKKGDVYELVYSSGHTLLYANGDLRERIEGADFAAAYFGIWVSEYSISHKLRKALLGVEVNSITRGQR